MLEWLRENTFAELVEESNFFTYGKFWKLIADSAAGAGHLDALKWCVKFHEAWVASATKKGLSVGYHLKYLERCPTVAAQNGHLDVLKYLVIISLGEKAAYTCFLC